jgi:alkylated DNA repair dioxygenase AlkB
VGDADADEATGPFIDRDVAFERTWLDDASWIDVARGWIKNPEPFETAMREQVPWNQGRIWRYEKYVEDPRLTGFWAPGRGDPPHPILVEAHRSLSHRYHRFDSVAFCRYRDGFDGQAFHRDQEMRWLEDTVIVVLTLGAQRPWRLRPRANRHKDDALKGATHDLSPASGDVLVMGGACQARWEHSVPQIRDQQVGERISMQWRWTSKRGRPQQGPGYGAPLDFSDRPARRPR